MFKYLIALLLLGTITLYAQKVKIGFRVEPSLSYGSTENPEDKSRNYESLATRSGDIRASLSFVFSNNFTLSLRPGLVIGNYGGIAAGLFGSIRTYEEWYTLVGFDIMKPIGGGGHTSGSKDVTLPYPALGLGYNLNEKLSFELQFHYSLNQVTYAYNRVGVFPSGSYDYYKLFWLLKLSVGFYP